LPRLGLGLALLLSRVLFNPFFSASSDLVSSPFEVFTLAFALNLKPFGAGIFL